MYKQVLDPVGDSLLASALVAAIPIVVLFVLLGGVKMKAHWASLIALLAALLVAILFYSMPVGQALDAGLEGAAFGFFPIMYIVFVALWIYNMTVETGHFAVLRRAFNRVSDDQRDGGGLDRLEAERDQHHGGDGDGGAEPGERLE